MSLCALVSLWQIHARENCHEDTKAQKCRLIANTFTSKLRALVPLWQMREHVNRHEDTKAQSSADREPDLQISFVPTQVRSNGVENHSQY